MEPASAHLGALPPEILLDILALLDPLSAITLQRVCRLWRQVASSDACLRVVCHRHEVLESHQTIEDVKKPAQSSIMGRRASRSGVDGVPPIEISRQNTQAIESYQDLIRERFFLERIKPIHSSVWSPASRVARFANPLSVFWAHEMLPPDVWRVKVDATDHCFITTHTEGGLFVTCRETSAILFRQADVRPYAHLEASEGYVVHDAEGDTFRLWRFERLCPETTESGPRRGNLIEVGTLTSPRPVRAFRLQFPILSIATRDFHVVLIDVRSRCVTQVFPLNLRASAESLDYIENDRKHIFLASNGRDVTNLWAPSRTSRDDYGVLDVISAASGQKVQSLSLQQMSQDAQWSIVSYPELSQTDPLWSWTPSRPVAADQTSFHYELMAVHHDTFTGALVILTRSCALLVIEDYRDWLENSDKQATPRIHGVQADLPTARSISGGYLAVHRGQICHHVGDRVVLTDIRRLFAARTKAMSGQSPTTMSSPATSFSCAYRLPLPVDQQAGLVRCSCIQMDDTSLTIVAALGHRKQIVYPGACLLGLGYSIFSFEYGQWAELLRLRSSGVPCRTEDFAGKVLLMPNETVITHGEVVPQQPDYRHDSAANAFEPDGAHDGDTLALNWPWQGGIGSSQWSEEEDDGEDNDEGEEEEGAATPESEGSYY